MAELNKYGEISDDCICPECGNSIEPHWKACPECGTKLSNEPIVCIHCGSPLKPRWKVCPECGIKISDSKKRPTGKKKKKTSDKGLQDQFIEAVVNHNYDLAQDLLDDGADINGRCKQKMTALWFCCVDNLEGVKWLLEHGADPNILGFLDDPPLYTALIGPMDNNRLKIIELLIAAGADVNHVFEDGLKIIDWASDKEEARQLLLKHGARM